MIHRLLFLLTMTFSFYVLAEESVEQKLSCLLERPFIFGASISAGYANLDDAIGAFTKMKASELFNTDDHYLGRNPDPITRLAQLYNESPEITNIAEIVNQMEHSSVGAEQFFDYVSKPTQEAQVRSSSVLASIDGLYWPTIYGKDCSYTNYAISKTREIIRYAHRHEIPLLLGSVPNEDPSKVSALLRGNKLIPASWSPPKIACLQKVNQFLRRECRLDNQCYIIDLHRIVENLKGSQGPYDKPGIPFQGERYSYNDFRQDGVHLWNAPSALSLGKQVPHGMQYLMVYIEKSIGWNLPNCKK